ncbi:hypothetical protein CPT_Moonbeam137 [Bacillus phage Moonbeam]|uniref:Uncharacterized protein n=1 Tax=Bacillus phage Moonbeam TaxID=1540091 RepID=A0A0A0RN79_9CAUD|nr:hypothetical protein CPT_Moonbeam137 [Bacillus phage Moonbeam]AIW03535.1 hypothetical protein CPT_Moonbeam137 [Bacillus phage Moonbeam]
MGFCIKFILPLLLIFFMIESYFTGDPVFMLIMALGSMPSFWMIGRIYEAERR